MSGMLHGMVASGLARASDDEVTLICRALETMARAWRTGDEADAAEAAALEAEMEQLLAGKRG